MASPSVASQRSETSNASWPFLSEALHASPVAVLVVLGDGRIQFANRGLAGEPGSALAGRTIDEIVPPEQRERLRAACDAVLRGSASEEFEFGERGPAGPTRWFQAYASPAQGEPRAVTILVVDITAHKREEDRLRRSEQLLVDAQDTAHMGTWEWDITQPTATWSPELYRIYGLTPETYTPSYEAYLKMVHPDDRERVKRATEAVFKEHTRYSHDERIFRPDGTMRYLHTWAYPVLDERGQLLRLVGVCQDVTEARLAEGAMRTQTLTRALARRLVQDLVRRGSIPEKALRDMGRSLVHDQDFERRSPESYVAAFVDMGLGQLRFDRSDGPRSTFIGSDLLERRGESTLPTCFATLGYLEGLVSITTGKPARGNEMRCQSMGHKECVFVVMAQDA